MNTKTKEDKLAKIQEYSKPMVSDLGKLADETKGVNVVPVDDIVFGGSQ
ncbi:hypothetical protein [Zhongshania sp.]|jgi:hypothetical protein